MKYAQIRKYDTANGPGIRSTLFVSGCTHRCAGCFNQDYQDFNYGDTWTEEVENNFIEMVKDSNVHGVTILGGEPLQQDDSMASLFIRIKEDTGKSLWVFTGYTFEHLLQMIANGTATKTMVMALLYADVLVDGPFIESKKDLRLKFRGSSNQRILDVKKSIEKGEAVECLI